jgi:DNA-binding FadR family transcriptional regulator
MSQKYKISQEIAMQLEEMIAQGSLMVGEKLPPERELSKSLNVSRPSLREAKQILASKGLLISKQGGGTFVSESLNSGLTDPLMELLTQRPEFRYDILEVRHALDSEAAYYAALRANSDDKSKITAAFEYMQEVQSIEFDSIVAARADADFHLSITEASHNVALLHITRSLYQVLQTSIEQNLHALHLIKKSDNSIQEQHEHIKEAIILGDAEAAKKATHSHMSYVEESMNKLFKEQERSMRYIKHASILKK